MNGDACRREDEKRSMSAFSCLKAPKSCTQFRNIDAGGFLTPVEIRGAGHMTTHFPAQDMVEILRRTMIALVRKDGPDLSARQLGVLLTCYLDEETGHTVRGLAAALNVSKPAITRALDRLTELELAKRKVDLADRRSVLVEHTTKGVSFMRDLRTIMAANAAENEKQLAASVSMTA
jgi:DNA-binding MarR family transcriptional regulator